MASAESAEFDAERLDRIQPAMQRYIDQSGYRGIDTLIARRGQVIYHGQVGYQDFENQVPLAPDTIYRIYSMTKPIVCVALMTLYEQGRFQLVDPVANYLPAFADVKVMEGATRADARLVDLDRPIQIRDLMTHTSGLTYNFLEDSPVCELYRQANTFSDADTTLAQLVDTLASLPLAYQPGTRYHYSMGIDVVAHLIQVLSDQPLQTVLKERVLDPLGMSDTGFCVAPENASRLSKMYGNPDVACSMFSEINEADARGENLLRDVEDTNPSDGRSSFARGGHGLFSTTRDYYRFAQMLLNRGELDGSRILAPKIADLMHMNHLPAALRPFEIGGTPYDGYGFGLGSRVLLDVAQSALPGSVGEYGWSGAATTHYWVDPQEEIVGLLMSQYMMSVVSPVADFRVLAYQALVD